MNNKVSTILLLLLLTLWTFSGFLPTLAAPEAIVKAYSEVAELGDPVTMPDIVGTTFKVAIVVENVQNLYGFDIQVNWTTRWIRYVSPHQTTIPVEDYPSPVPPSPYGGILHEPTMTVKDIVDEANALPGAVEGTMGWFAYSSMAPAEPFTGNGTVVVLTFQVVDQPWDYEGPATVVIHFVSTDLSDPAPAPIAHTAEDLVITLHPRVFAYPPVPLLKIEPSAYTAGSLGEIFTYDVWLMGEGGTELAAFWDVAGIDVYINFNKTLMNAVDVAVDPDGWFASFWPGGVLTVITEINNTEGWVHVAFLGVPGLDGDHIPPNGIGRIISVNFTAVYEHLGYPPPTDVVYLRNPRTYVYRLILDADAGLIDLSAPVGTDWHAINPADYGTAVTIDAWVDNDGDGSLSPGDDLVITDKNTGIWHRYELREIKGTLELTQEWVRTSDDYIWVANFPVEGLENYGLPGTTVAPPTSKTYDGFGDPYWTGNFSLSRPITAVERIIVHHFPFTPDEYTEELVEGVDFIVHPDEDLIELLRPLDDVVLNEHWVDGVNNTLNGWPSINYVASGIQSVYVRFPNGTERFARNLGYQQPPPSEWWYEPEWPWELEGWWALGYPGLAGPWTWPDGSEWWINYTAATYLTIEYAADPEPTPFYVEYAGTYEEFLTLTDPIGTEWIEMYPWSFRKWTCTDWVDADGSGDISVGDSLILYSDMVGEASFRIDRFATDITVDQYMTVDDRDPTSPYYGMEKIVDIAGFPHPERDMPPWYGKVESVPIPHVVEDATYTAPYKVLGRAIDVYTQYPDPFGGQGPNNPSDAFGPQMEVVLYANVTYNLWPVQQKLVSFQIWHGEWNFTLCNTTDENGVAWVKFRIPWPCDDPEGRVFGTWNVVATVDIAEVVVNDTLTFEVDYLIDIVSIVPSKGTYVIGEHLSFNVTYRSISRQIRTAYITLVVYDDLGVPIAWWTLGPFDVEYGTFTITIECLTIPKHTFPGVGKVYVNILDDLPSRGGSQYCPQEVITIGINPP